MLERLTLLEFILRLIPETMIFVFASYVFSNIRVDIKKLLHASVLLSMSVFIVRALPITYGVHTILNLIIQTIVIAYVCKISVLKLIKSGIISTILLLISEGISMFFYSVVLKIDLSVIFQDDIKKVVYGLPSLIIFATIVFIYYYFSSCKGNRLSNV